MSPSMGTLNCSSSPACIRLAVAMKFSLRVVFFEPIIGVSQCVPYINIAAQQLTCSQRLQHDQMIWPAQMTILQRHIQYQLHDCWS